MLALDEDKIPASLIGGYSSFGRYLRFGIAIFVNCFCVLGFYSLGWLLVDKVFNLGLSNSTLLMKIANYYFSIFNTVVFSAIEVFGFNVDDVLRIAISMTAIVSISKANISLHINLFKRNSQVFGLASLAAKYLTEPKRNEIHKVETLSTFATELWLIRNSKLTHQSLDSLISEYKLSGYIEDIKHYCDGILEPKDVDTFIQKTIDTEAPFSLRLLSFLEAPMQLIMIAPFFLVFINFILNYQ